MPSNNNTNGRNMSQHNKYNYKNKNNKDAANYQICRLIELLDNSKSMIDTLNSFNNSCSSHTCAYT